MFVKGPFDDGEREANLNVILREGDQVRTGANTFAELEFPGYTFARLDEQTRVDVERINDGLVLSVRSGRVYLARGGGAPDASISNGRVTAKIEQATIIRFDADEHVVRVAEGRADASCERRSENRTERVGERETLTCADAELARGDWDRKTSTDAFEVWVRDREAAIRGTSAPPEGVAGEYEGLHDLSDNGHWVVVEERHYWRPIVVAGWRPYYDGYWIWYDSYGWTWIDHRPWGYVTHHYGRWVWFPRHGWVWSPARGFSGAWVVWSSFDGYLGWAPCDYSGRPLVIVARHSYYDVDVWSFSRPHYFWSGGGRWRQTRGHSVAKQEPFFTLDDDELRTLKPSVVSDPRRLLPEHSMSRAAGPQSGRRESDLAKLIDVDRARRINPHEHAINRAPKAFRIPERRMMPEEKQTPAQRQIVPRRQFVPQKQVVPQRRVVPQTQVVPQKQKPVVKPEMKSAPKPKFRPVPPKVQKQNAKDK